MRPDLVVWKVSSVGVALMFILLAAGVGLSVLLNNPASLVVLGLVGLYLLFAIRKADQWEKVAVLRFGKYVGLRGPGLFALNAGLFRSFAIRERLTLQFRAESLGITNTPIFGNPSATVGSSSIGIIS